MSVPVFREQDNGRTVQEAIGGRFCVELAENPTTGYRWSRPEFDEGLLGLESDDAVPAAGGAIGAGGIRRFVFSAKATGSAGIRFAYRRAWEADATPAKRFELTIVTSQP